MIRNDLRCERFGQAFKAIEDIYMYPHSAAYFFTHCKFRSCILTYVTVYHAMYRHQLDV